MATTSSRRLRFVSLLSTHRHWSWQELAVQLKISRRTLRRDIEGLGDLGHPLDVQRPDKHLLPLVWLGPAAAAAKRAHPFTTLHCQFPDRRRELRSHSAQCGFLHAQLLACAAWSGSATSGKCGHELGTSPIS
nr:helix-turn-helix domain-containing protein [Ferrimicrobium sp.]